MIKQLKWYCLAVSITALPVIAPSSFAEEKPDQLTIFTSVSGSSWYGIGAGMADIFAENGVPSNPELGASISNIANVSTGKGELGLSNSPAITVAERGDKPFSVPLTNVRVIAALSENLMHIFTDANSEFNSVRDLKGEPFMTQRPGSITAVVFDELLGVSGLTRDDVNMLTGSLTEQQDGMKDRRVKGMVSIASYPSSWGGELAKTVPIKFLPVDEETYIELASRMPTVGRGMIKAGTYENQDTDIPTITAKMILVASDEMTDDEAYWVTKTLAGNLGALQRLHASFKTLTIEDMADVPGGGLHPGAERFYREIGALK